jgi:hypothetical protein
MRKYATIAARIHGLLPSNSRNSSSTLRLAMSSAAATTALGRATAPGRAASTAVRPPRLVSLVRRARAFAALPAVAHAPRAGQAVRAAAVRLIVFVGLVCVVGAWHQAQSGAAAPTRPPVRTQRAVTMPCIVMASSRAAACAVARGEARLRAPPEAGAGRRRVCGA